MSDPAARRILVEGIVQGVGFRPFVHTLAERHHLAGWVRNTAGGVEVEVEGASAALDAFLDELSTSAPPLARVDWIRMEPLAPRGHRGFRIEASGQGEGFLPVPPDVATCAACLREITDPGDRRFGYPFTNCTHCGPRWTVIRALPYDRPNTTMAGFTMCAACRAEYENPDDRRFHAQPNACPACGPRVSLVDAEGRVPAGDPLAATQRLLASGAVVAIKGIGGFHLACDAGQDAVVERLRQRKGREGKPLALMVRDLGTAERLAVLSDAQRALLSSPARPIVLVPRRSGSSLAPSIAPGLRDVGLMLPYSPLHHLLFREPCPEALVMTSGNRSEEPIATDNDEARARLSGVADAFLLHDRPIEIRCDDSVTRWAREAELPIRRSRGYAPFPVLLPFESSAILAVGAELKSTVCLARGRYAFVSPHVGDLGNYDTFASYGRMVEHMAGLFRIRPEAVAHDLHPGYVSTRYALGLDPALTRIAVQHHHAHVAACMAEHRLEGPVIGVAFDGTGYGTDGHVWGGEFLIADYAGFRRAAQWRYVPMPGGDRAVREPFRMALAHLASAGLEWDRALPPVTEATDTESRVIALQVERGLNAPLTSSVGRLFDAVASLVGVRQRARYEAQAAIELEALVEGDADGVYPIVIADGNPMVVEAAPVVGGVVANLRATVPVPVIAARFHATVADVIARVCGTLRCRTGIERVVLSGGVFQNVTLLTGAVRALGEAGFEVFTHRLVPPNDGGIALGQAAVAHALLASRAARRSSARVAAMAAG